MRDFLLPVALDGIGVPFAAFIHQAGRCRPESMRRDIIGAVAEASQSGVECIVGNRARRRADAGERKSAVSRNLTQSAESGHGLIAQRGMGKGEQPFDFRDRRRRAALVLQLGHLFLGNDAKDIPPIVFEGLPTSFLLRRVDASRQQPPRFVLCLPGISQGDCWVDGQRQGLLLSAKPVSEPP